MEELITTTFKYGIVCPSLVNKMNMYYFIFDFFF